MASISYLYRQIVYKKEIEEIEQGFASMFTSHTDYLALSLVLLLMLVNWGLEALKWKMLVERYERISFFTALEAIFTGVTVSIFTPNRVGEYAGRIFHLANADLIKVSLATFIGNIAQLLATFIFGLLGLLFIFPKYFAAFSIFSLTAWVALCALVIGGCLFSIVLFLNSRLLTAVIGKLRFLGRLRKYGRVFSAYSRRELITLLLLSFVRYGVFSFQYYLLLRIFEVSIPFYDAMAMIFSIFLIMAIIPTVSVAELGIRGSVSLYLFGILSGNSMGIVTTSFALWLINLAFPAVLGALFVFNLKLIRKNNKYFDLPD